MCLPKFIPKEPNCPRCKSDRWIATKTTNITKGDERHEVIYCESCGCIIAVFKV